MKVKRMRIGHRLNWCWLIVWAALPQPTLANERADRPADPAPPAATSAPADSFRYLDPAVAAQIVESLKPPPARGSAAEKADLEKVIKEQDWRSKRKCSKALPDGLPDFTGFVKANADIFSQPKLRQEIFDLLRDTMADAEILIRQAQQHWPQPHPSARDARIHPCPGTVMSAESAFPSATAARYQLVANILANLTINDSEKEMMRKYAQEAGKGRVLAGTHSPSDVAAGQELGDRLFEQLMRNEKYNKRFGKLADRVHAWQFRVNEDEDILETRPFPARARQTNGHQ